jgi:hypothetical protein
MDGNDLAKAMGDALLVIVGIAVVVGLLVGAAAVGIAGLFGANDAALLRDFRKPAEPSCKTGQYRWNKRDLAYCIYDRVPGIAADDFADVIGAGYKAWADVCDLRFTQVTDYRKADLLVLARRIDRKGGILAEHQLPPGNDMQLRGWLDLAESWTLDMLLGVWTHELGHGCGLSHTTRPQQPDESVLESRHQHAADVGHRSGSSVVWGAETRKPYCSRQCRLRRIHLARSPAWSRSRRG